MDAIKKPRKMFSRGPSSPSAAAAWTGRRGRRGGREDDILVVDVLVRVQPVLTELEHHT